MLKALRVGMLALVTCAASQLYAQPRLKVVDGTKLNFGLINRGSVVQKKVFLKNIGTGVLVIGKAEASCGCTAAVVSEDHISPGKTGTLLITFNSKNFSGPIHKTVTVNSNSDVEPRTVIEFTGTVFEEVLLIPSQLLFRDAPVGSVTSQTLIVKNNGKEKLTLKGYRTQLPGLSLKLPNKSIAPNDSAKIVVELKPTAAKPLLSEVVYLTTSSAIQPEVTIYVYGNTKEFKFQ